MSRSTCAFPPRQTLERALAATRGDTTDLRGEADAAVAAAARLRDRLADRQAEHAGALEEMVRSGGGWPPPSAHPNAQRLRDELEQVTVSRLHLVLTHLAAEQGAPSDPVFAAVGRARTQLRRALHDLDAWADGILPAPLEEGIGAALAELGAASPVPVTVELPRDGRLPENIPIRVQEGLYFVAAEAIANAMKHAGASVLRVSLRVDTAARLTVADDGAGGAGAACGRGLDSMRERAAEVGGGVVVTSPPGRGTTVRMTVPLTGVQAR